MPGFSPEDAKVTDISQKPSKLDPSVYSAVLAKVNAISETRFVAISGDVAHDNLHPLLADHAIFAPRFTEHVLNVTFATFKSQPRNSFVLVKRQVGVISPVVKALPGQIRDIFHHSRNEAGSARTSVFFNIQLYAPLVDNDVLLDPYRQFSGLETALYYNRFEPDIFVAALDDLVGHFAACVYTPEDINEECIVVRSLDKVCVICNQTMLTS